MSKIQVSIAKYEKEFESVKKVVTQCDGLSHMPSKAKVFIKPNIVFWTTATDFPKWGVITTSRVIEDVVAMLKSHGIDDITIGEGSVVMNPKDKTTAKQSFEGLGYDKLKQKYGVKYLSVFDRPFEKVDLGHGIELNFNTDIIHSDFVINLPVLKTHNQTMVSLGIKNLKGTIDILSRKKCHQDGTEQDLNFYISKLADKMPPMLTILDGIFTNERGPNIDGKLKRSDILIASKDVLAADMVGATVLGYLPSDIPHLVHAAKHRAKKIDLSEIEIVGLPIDSVKSRHEFDFVYQSDENCEIPLPLAKQGLKGIFYRKFDLSMCTYCSGINGIILTAIRNAYKGEAWDKIEVLTGKVMKPTPGMNKTILIGQCMYKANKDNPDIKEMLAVKSCPPDKDKVVEVLHKAGIPVDPALFEQMDKLPGFLMAKYQNKPEFDPSFFQVK